MTLLHQLQGGILPGAHDEPGLELFAADNQWVCILLHTTSSSATASAEGVKDALR